MVDVKIYTWTYCPFCIRAKNLLAQKGVKFHEEILDGKDQELDQLRQKTGHKTVPQIFINGQFVGGFSELSQLDQQGELDKKLQGL